MWKHANLKIWREVDLQFAFHYRVPNEHRIGSTSPLEVIIIVFNRGEDSFNTNLWIDLPTGVKYETISHQRSNVAISCDTLIDDNTKVQCGLGNPMQKGSEVIKQRENWLNKWCIWNHVWQIGIVCDIDIPNCPYEIKLQVVFVHHFYIFNCHLCFSLSLFVCYEIIIISFALSS